MGMTMAEKILAQAAHKKSLLPGEIIEVEPDVVFTHDHQGPMAIREFQSFENARIWDPRKLFLAMDHRTPSQTEVSAANHKMMREFAERQHIERVFDVGSGICHDLLAEKALARPGQIVLGTDSHTTTIGAFSILGTGVGSSEMAAIWLRGVAWLRVPESIRVVLKGRLASMVDAKDIALAMLRILGTDGATYKSVEFQGDGIAALNTDHRMTLCNMCLEMGAKTALFPTDDTIKKYYADRGINQIEEIHPDPDAVYSQTIEIQLNDLEPLVARPSSPQNVVTAEEAGGDDIRLDQALIGTCTNGRLTDIRQAAAVLKGKKVAPSVRFLIVPATREILKKALDEGLISIFIEAGAMVGVPCCGPCGAYGMGTLTDDEYCISSGSRNFIGRLGSVRARIYIASPATVTASAIAGTIVSPRIQNKRER